ncbi:Hpt domain-containing protein [Qipengyuania sp. 6B39]|uniref:Hpt domain-containing protein n=1 Tax=Qipengyuania proteolytica TaxID=2867239 RepID=UPI001C89BDD6|nr:Hpt domain-containing protein [Qipengyuania proteolytica]MBX7497008.1 Hpt domain-containing protein [Qipengyuania proteolytica]
MNDIEDKLAALSARFAAAAEHESLVMESASSQGDWQAVRDRAHAMAGTAPMLGFAAIGDAALALELAIESGGDPAAALKRLDALLRAASSGS